MTKYFIRNPLSVVGAVLLVLPLWAGIRTTAAATSKTFTGEVTDTICAATGSHAAMMEKMPGMGKDGATCTKKCMDIGAKYAFIDDSTKTVYVLQDSSKVQAMAGRKVRLTGTLEGNKINVTNVDVVG